MCSPLFDYETLTAVRGVRAPRVKNCTRAWNASGVILMTIFRFRRVESASLFPSQEEYTCDSLDMRLISGIAWRISPIF
jgi:hypothetical protein